MKLLIYAHIFICLAFINAVSSQNDHILQMELNKFGTTNNMVISSTLAFPTFNNSDLFESDISTSVDDKVRLHRFAPNQNFELEVITEALADNDLDFGFSEFNTNSMEFKFDISANSTYQLITPGYTSPTENYTSNTIFRITKCEENIGFYVDNILKHVTTFPITTPQFEAFLKVLEAHETDIYVSTKIITDPCISYSMSSYSVINTAVPTNCTLIESNKILKFYYIQKYAIVPGENDVIQINVYDDKHVLLNNTPYTLSNKYGSNYKEVDLSAIPGTMNNYIVEFKNINKRTPYYLKLISE